MKLLLDMNLSPKLIEPLRVAGHDAVHWSVFGPLDSSDRTIMEAARAEQRFVVTHDLDFAAILALTRETGPSVVQIRTLDIRVEAVMTVLLGAIEQFAEELARGAIVIVEPARSRARLLPLR